MTAEEAAVGYCEYLDKEMTIMGLLSVFAVVVPALVLDRTAGAKNSDQEVLAHLWMNERGLLLAGSVALLLAGLMFYLQRSELAYYYGQLRFSLTKAAYPTTPTKDLLEKADSWATWIPYTTGFVLLGLGFFYYGSALIVPDFVGQYRGVWIAIPALLAALAVAANWHVKRTYRYSDTPWSDWLSSRQLKSRVRS